MAEIYWWVVLGYPPFDMGKDGFPCTGQVVKYYRERKKDHAGKPYTQSALAHVLGISQQCMRDIENRDLAMDHHRRHFLSELLDIPPILFGITTLSEIQKLLELNPKPINAATILSTSARTGVKLVVDTREYGDHLRYLLTTHKSNSAHETKNDTLLRIDTMYRELPHVKDAEQLQIRELLCGYHRFVADLLRDHQLYDDAMGHINKSVRLAKYLQKDELIAIVLLTKGRVFDDMDSIEDVIYSYEDAIEYEKRIPYNLSSTILLYLGQTTAQTAQNKQEGENALALVDRVGNIIRSNQKEDNPYVLSLDLDHYHISRGATLIAIGRNQDAIDELNLVHAGPKYPRRQAWCDILLARAYINKGQYGESISSAESALDICNRIGSKVNIDCIMKIYRQLMKSPYKNSPDVARLGYMLRPYLSVIPY